MSKQLNEVIAGSSLDLNLSFQRFGQTVTPEENPTWVLLAQNDLDHSKWDKVTSGEIEAQAQMTLTISGEHTNLVEGTTLSRMILINWSFKGYPYKEVITFDIQSVPEVQI